MVLKNTILLARDLGKDVHLYTSKSPGFLSGIPGVTYHPNYYIRSRYRILTLVTFFFSQFLLAFRLLRHWGDSCTFYVNTILPFSAIWMGKLLGKKVMVHVHENEISPRLLNGFLFWTVKTFADEIIVVSKYLSKNPSLAPRKSHVIYNCVNQEIEQNAGAASVPKGKFKVLMLASLRPYKGINEFLKLAIEMPQVGFDLILSDSLEDVNHWKSGRSVPENLTILPVQKNVIPWYKSASLVVNLTHKDECVETFGMTILEGMKFGLPAIVPTQGGVTELVLDGENGFQIDYFDLDEIKRMIGKMQTDSHFWQELSQQALVESKKFSREAFISKMTSLLK